MSWDRQLAMRMGRTCTWHHDYLELKRTAPGKPEPSRMRIQDGNDEPQTIAFIGDGSASPAASASVLGYPGSVVVAFHATICEPGPDGTMRLEAVKDWLHGFRVELKGEGMTGLPGRAHEGVFKQLSSIAAPVRAAVREALSLRPGAVLHVTGHGQGGAIAALATKWLDLHGLTPAATYTFGAPRAADKDLAATVKSPVYRFEVGDDIVPHVPPRTAVSGVIGGLTRVGGFLALAPFDELLTELGHLASRAEGLAYASIGSLVYRDKGGTLRQGLDAAAEEALASRRARALLQSGKDLIEHHPMSYYLAMLER